MKNKSLLILIFAITFFGNYSSCDCFGQNADSFYVKLCFRDSLRHNLLQKVNFTISGYQHGIQSYYAIDSCVSIKVFSNSKYSMYVGAGEYGSHSFMFTTQDIKDGQLTYYLAPVKLGQTIHSNDVENFILFQKESYKLEKSSEHIIDLQIENIKAQFKKGCLPILAGFSSKEERDKNPDIGLLRSKAVIDYIEKKYNMPRGKFYISDMYCETGGIPCKNIYKVQIKFTSCDNEW